MARLEKITFAEMRESGARDVLIYYCDHRCSHHIRISPDQWPDDRRVSDIEDRFACLGFLDDETDATGGSSSVLPLERRPNW